MPAVLLLLAACAQVETTPPPAQPSFERSEPRAAAPTVVAGPMVGHVGSERARIWAQGSRGGWFLVEVSADGETWQRTSAPNGRDARAWFDPENELTSVYDVRGLEPATRYEYRLVNRDGVLPAVSEQSFTTPPPVGQAEDLVVAFGSCAGEWGIDATQPIFGSIDALRPGVFLWLGDNVYFERPGLEWSDPQLMAERWRISRAKEALQPLLRRSAHYAIWDDHDYGPDNSDKLYRFRDESFRLFTRYWANPSYGSDGQRGVWHRFARGRVEFFLLDNRYHREPNWMEAGAGKTQFGETQWRWLETALAQSRADFKILVSPTQVLARYHDFESWKLFPADRARLLRLLEARSISGVVLLSGDRHTGEVQRWDPPTAPYPLYEFTASPLAAGIGLLVPDDAAPDRLPGTGVAEENFGVLRFDFAPSDPVLRFESRGADGALHHAGVSVRLSQLRPRD